MYFFWESSNTAVSWLSRVIGIDKWLHHQQSSFLSFIFLMGGIMVRLVLVFFYFSLFKYLFLIIGSPVFAYLSEQTAGMPLFYHPSLAIALQLMDLNDRDEPARFEPMTTGENQAACQEILHTDWSKYKYATILIPGNGPELTTTPISPINKMRQTTTVHPRHFLLPRNGIPAYGSL